VDRGRGQKRCRLVSSDPPPDDPRRSIRIVIRVASTLPLHLSALWIRMCTRWQSAVSVCVRRCCRGASMGRARRCCRGTRSDRRRAASRCPRRLVDTFPPTPLRVQHLNTCFVLASLLSARPALVTIVRCPLTNCSERPGPSRSLSSLSAAASVRSSPRLACDSTVALIPSPSVPLCSCSLADLFSLLSAVVVWSRWSALLLSVCLPLFSVSLPLPSGLFFPSSAPFSVSLVTSQTTNERPNNNDNNNGNRRSATQRSKTAHLLPPLPCLCLWCVCCCCMGWRPRLGGQFVGCAARRADIQRTQSGAHARGIAGCQSVDKGDGWLTRGSQISAAAGGRLTRRQPTLVASLGIRQTDGEAARSWSDAVCPISCTHE